MTRPCDGCGSTDFIPAPMLYDDAWAKLAGPRDLLCFPCLCERATERRVDLSVASLKPCPVNLFHSPMSWFDLFMSSEREPPLNIDEWNQVRETL